MSFKFIPAIQKLSRKHGIVPIGTEEITFYLYKRFCRTVGERQLLDAEKKNHNEGQFIIAQLADKISKDKNISFDQAFEYIFQPQPQDSKYADDAAHLEGLKNFKPLLEYPDEMKALNGLKAQTNKLQCIIATILMQTRVAFPIQLASNAVANTEEITLVSLPFVITDKSVFKSEGMTLTVVGNYQPSDEEVTIKVLPLSQNLATGRTLFLTDFETGKEKIGYPEWTHKDTDAFPEEVVEQFYAFYQREEAGLDEIAEITEEEVTEKNELIEPPTKSLTATDSSVNSLPSTGESSITESPVTA